MPPTRVHGLVLAGGLSNRMGTDKSLIIYPKLSPHPQRESHFQLLQSTGLDTYLSCRESQKNSDSIFSEKIILDREDLEGGPGVGILSAHLTRPSADWLVLACDFPFANKSAIETLLQVYAKNKTSVCYRHEDGCLETLFALWTADDLHYFYQRFLEGSKSPRRALEERSVTSMLAGNKKILANINSPDEATEYPELLK